jgi:hypothetical protein
MQCPECKGDAPPNNFYCPHCRAELPYDATSGIAAAAAKAEKAERIARAERAAAYRPRGQRLHSRKLYEIGWQAMQWILVVSVFAGAFVAYKRVNWQGAATRVNEVASAVRPVEAAGGISSKPAQRNAIAASAKRVANEKSQPMALQPTANAGLLMIKSSAAAARIFVDGKFAGTTPHSFTVNAGEHQLRLEAEGYQVWTRTIAVRGNQQMGIMAALEK